MLGRNGADALQLEQDAAVADEVSDIAVAQQLSVILDRQGHARLERDLALRELEFQALLIYGLQVTWAHGPIDVEDGPANAKGFLLVNELTVAGTFHSPI